MNEAQIQPHGVPTVNEHPQPPIYNRAETNAEHSLDHAVPAVSDPELIEQQRQQLQLIQLCFYEHEFGVLVDEDDEDDVDTAAIGDSATARYGDFDPMTFIETKLSHGATLEDLSKDLTFYMEHIKEQINFHVNNDMHTAFVDVSGRLGGMESELQYVERPLAASIKKVSASCEELVSVADAVDVKLGHASDVEEERTFDIHFLKGLLLYERIASTIEDDLAPLIDSTLAAASSSAPQQQTLSSRHASYFDSPTNRGSPEAMEGSQSGPGGSTSASSPLSPPQAAGNTGSSITPHTLEQLEAISMSARQLKSLAAMLPCLPQREKERAEVREYVRESGGAVLQLLRRVFTHLCSRFFEHPEEAGVTQALREVTLTYARAHVLEDFCTMFRDGVLGPFLEKIFPWKAATQARQSADETLRLLASLEQQLSDNVTPLFPLLRRCFAGEPLNPASAMLWPVLCEVLIKKLVTLYEVGIPDAFQRKYTAAYRLLALAESCCATPEELVVLRQSPDVTMWNHKWNTDVYAAMRITEFTKALEPRLAALRGGRPLAELRAPPAAAAAHLDVFKCLGEQLQRLFSPQVFLLVCLQRFLRHVVTAAQEVCLAATAYTRSSLDKTSTYGGPRESPLPFLSLFTADVAGLARSAARGGALNSQALAAIAASGIAPSADNGCATAAEAVLALLRDQICHGCVSEAQRLMTSSVEDECLAALQNLKSVRSAYSHTKKPMPKAASWYVASVVDPIARFATTARESGVDPQALSLMVRSVIDVIATQFTALARDTLITAKKTEESWEKLRRKKEPSTAEDAAEASTSDPSPSPPAHSRPTAESATDRDKMTIQLYLDARALESATSPLTGGSSAHSEHIAALFALLRRAEWILGAEIPEPPELEEN